MEYLQRGPRIEDRCPRLPEGGKLNTPAKYMFKAVINFLLLFLLFPFLLFPFLLFPFLLFPFLLFLLFPFLLFLLFPFLLFLLFPFLLFLLFPFLLFLLFPFLLFLLFPFLLFLFCLLIPRCLFRFLVWSRLPVLDPQRLLLLFWTLCCCSRD